uniref:Low density lipoprotein receptor class A domain containing 2 n=1 Tax=Latimeria chalumnae TaxID=7897 RepID=H2ZWC0_LATCH
SVNLVDFCGQTIRGDGMIVNSHREAKKDYFVTVGTDCRLTMQASSLKDKVQFHFRLFMAYSLLRVSFLPNPTTVAQPQPETTTTAPPSIDTSKPGQKGLAHVSPLGDWEAADPCNAGSYVQFYDGRDRSAPAIGPPLCGRSIPSPILSSSNYLTLQLVTRGQQPRVDFVGDFTSFRLGLNSSECTDEPYFLCGNGKCIPTSLVCDNKDIDNCGDGSDQSPLQPAHCKDPSTTAIPRKAASSSTTQSTTTASTNTNVTCGAAGRSQPLLPNNIPKPDSITDKERSVSLLALYIVLGVIAGVVLLFWCCWSPGWFVWRLSVCRFVPCCNSFCSSCQLCTRSCSRKEPGRLAKVTPHTGVAIDSSSKTTLRM